MKKLALVLLLVFSLFSFAACEDYDFGGNEPNGDEDPNGDPGLTDEDKVLEAIHALTLSHTELVVDHLSLPTKGLYDIAIVWESSNSHVISEAGVIRRPGVNQDVAEVTLTATMQLGAHTEVKSFLVTVPSRDGLIVTGTDTLSFTNLATEYTVANGSLDVYFMSGGGLPYVNIQDFVLLLDGAIESHELEFVPNGDTLLVSYTIEYEDDDDAVYEALFDFEANVLTLNTFDFFSDFSSATETDFGSGLSTVDLITTPPEDVIIPLGYYGFDIAMHEELHLIPFHLANLFFSGSMYDVYYNGDDFYGVDTYQLMDDATLSQTLRTSSFNSLDMPDDVKNATYDFLALSLDYFYGLKDVQNVSTYYNRLFTRRDALLNGSDRDNYLAVRNFALSLDDLHTSHMFTGFYESNYTIPTYLEDLRPRVRTYYNNLNILSSTCSSRPKLRYMDEGKIAVIFIDGFTFETPDQVASQLEAIALKGGVESIVIDLTCNSGGNIGAVYRTLGFLTDEPMAIHSMNPTDRSTSSYFLSSDNVKVDTDWYILTSPITFSAANLMTSVAKDMGIATIIGEKSSGGASSISMLLVPNGSGLLISSTNVLTNDQHVSIEFGIDVDIELWTVTQDHVIVNGINNHKNS